MSQPFDTCPECGSDDLVIVAERVHSLEGRLSDDMGEQIVHGTLVCAAQCGPLHSLRRGYLERIEATLERAAMGGGA